MKDVFNAFDRMIAVSEFAKHIPQYLEKTKDGPLFITKNRDVKAILLSPEEYRKLIGGKK